MDANYKEALKKQGYVFIGEHSAVKTCAYTGKSLAGKGNCYKQKFYGIQSHRCVQMSVAVNFCNLDCTFCWRERNNSAFGKIDDPVRLADNAIAAQRRLLSGFGGNPSTPKEKWAESKEPLHFAISLNGENTAYPRLGEFIAELKRRGHSTFLVTNGQLPEILRKMEREGQLPTQIYISMSAPTEETFKTVDRPLYKDGWERLKKSLQWLSTVSSKTRTVVRLTIIKGVTSQHIKEYAELVKIASPTYLEVKSYMYLGASKARFERKNMNSHADVLEFCNQLAPLAGYKIIDDQEISRVALMMKEDRVDRLMEFPQSLPLFEKDSKRFDVPFKGYMEIQDVESCDGCTSDETIEVPIAHLIQASPPELAQKEELLKIKL
ncbi:MAG: 4-demethylwyosine synthase TYW1 [Nanoarchaeota archaeon]|nr:MAG: 4-demethylwyosine synthase TYW1 [Nanoarchaeota archaeon]